MDERIITVLGAMPPDELGVTDAHNHLWISPPMDSSNNLFVLDQEEHILEELKEYKAVGGCSQIDCQPGGAGRDGNRLRALSQQSGVNVVACTGFHLRDYYPDETEIWNMDVAQATNYFLSEIKEGLTETRGGSKPVFPGFIKIAVLGAIEKSPLRLIEAAVNASVDSGYAIEMHTEKGAAVEDFVELFSGLGLALSNLVICHIDKRPDLGIHKELAQAGCLLAYDTFFRPKYQPEKNLWILIREMIEAGFDKSIALATDLADKGMWNTMGDGPGLAGFVQKVNKRLDAEISDKSMIKYLMGRNICRHIAIYAEEAE